MSNEAVQHINSEFLPELSMILDKFLVKFPLFDKGNEVHLSYLSKIISEYDEKNELIIDRIEDVKIEMGVTIVFFMYARQTGKPQYEQLAEQYLNRIINSIYGGDVISEENDLLFIGCGLLYLLRNNFIEGEEDEIFSEIDTTLLKRLINRDDRIETNWYAWLYYFRHRLSCEHLPDWGDSGIDFRPNAIYLFDCLKRSIQYGRKRDKNVISEVEIFHQMKLHPEKTKDLLSLLTSIDNDKVTFVIPLRIDSPERERNLDFILEQLTTLDSTNILVLEADKQSLYRLKKCYSNVTYIYVEDQNPVFHRTKYLNQLLAKAEGAIVCVWDADVTMPEEQIFSAIELVKKGKAVMSFPYDGRLYMLSEEDSNAFVKSTSYEKLNEHLDKHYLVHGYHSVGGAFIVNRRIYMEAGGENEYIVGWGPEDAERANRMEILGLPVCRAEGVLFHLYHPRNENSRPAGFSQELINRDEFLKVCSMTKCELSDYIAGWTNVVNL